MILVTAQSFTDVGAKLLMVYLLENGISFNVECRVVGVYIYTGKEHHREANAAYHKLITGAL